MSSPFKDSAFLDADDVALLLRCDVSTVETKLRDGVIPGVKIGRGWIVPKPALVQVMSEQAIEHAAELRARRAPAAPSATTSPAARPTQHSLNVKPANEPTVARRGGRERGLASVLA